MNRSALPAWHTPEAHPALPAHEIHVWRAHVGQDDCHVDWLSAVERERHLAIGDPGLRQNFCAVRCILRRLLAGYLSCAPADVDIQLDPGGKPRVAGSALQFNLSHSHDQALLAFGRDIQVGVDIEIERPVRNIPQIAKRLFEPDEFAELQRQGFSLSRFLQYWTCHEARQKCLGRGIFGERAGEAGIVTRGIPIAGAQACIAWSDARPPPHLRCFTYPPGAPPSRL